MKVHYNIPLCERILSHLIRSTAYSQYTIGIPDEDDNDYNLEVDANFPFNDDISADE